MELKTTKNNMGYDVVELGEKVVAIVNGDSIQINQLKWNAKSNFDYDSIYLDKQTIIALAEQFKREMV